MSTWTVTLRKHGATWYYFTTNPQGGGFGSNYCGPKYIAYGKAVEYIPAGDKIVVVTNDKHREEIVKA